MIFSALQACSNAIVLDMIIIFLLFGFSISLFTGLKKWLKFCKLSGNPDTSDGNECDGDNIPGAHPSGLVHP